MPHHITQRGNRRQQTFFNEDDYAAYLALMAVRCGKDGVERCGSTVAQVGRWGVR